MAIGIDELSIKEKKPKASSTTNKSPTDKITLNKYCQI